MIHSTSRPNSSGNAEGIAPSACVRNLRCEGIQRPGPLPPIDLADGTEEEAFSSKYKYAQKRIAESSAPQLIESARAYLSEETHFDLAEQLAKIEDLTQPKVSTLTRRRLIALFDGRPLASEIEDIDLIRSLWPIAQMPSRIHGVGYTLEDDIHRHTIRNDDLSQRQLLELLGLLDLFARSALQIFGRRSPRPEAQTPEKQATFAQQIDDLLRKDGYTLAVAGKISGSPHYSVRAVPSSSPADESISAALAAFDPTQVHARWTSAMDRRASEPEGAITLSRTLLEDVCKSILDQAGETWQETDDLPVLYRKLAKTLKLAPITDTEPVFQPDFSGAASRSWNRWAHLGTS